MLPTTINPQDVTTDNGWWSIDMWVYRDYIGDRVYNTIEDIFAVLEESDGELYADDGEPFGRGENYPLMEDHVKAHGVQKPILVATRERAQREWMVDGETDAQFFIVDGHHRLMFAKRAGLTEVPIVWLEDMAQAYDSWNDFWRADNA